MDFRTLRADEIELRVGSVSKKGATLLLYKDARCDQNILDETVGPMNWQRHHSRDNANCVVSIWDSEKKQWVEKEDTGTESQTEKEKGLASDSFKRACVNWGLGRELYTAPFIFIECPTRPKENGRGFDLEDRFYFSGWKVKEVVYDWTRSIWKLVIADARGAIAYTWENKNVPLDNPKGRISEMDARVMKERMEEMGMEVAPVLKWIEQKSGYSARSIDELTREQYLLCDAAVSKAERNKA